MNIAALICAAGILTACTNIITQVIKQVTKEVCSTNIVAFVVAEALTIISGSIYCRGQGIETDVLVVVVLIFAGFAVSYGAMFGYDKLREVLDWSGDDDSTDSMAETAQDIVDEVLNAVAAQSADDSEPTFVGFNCPEDTDTVTTDGYTVTVTTGTEVPQYTTDELEAMTKAQLKELLDSMEIAYTSKTTKAELIALALWPQL